MSLFKKTGKDGKRSAKWHGRYRDHLGILRRVALATDKGAAQAMLAELVRRAERMKAGIVDPAEAHLRAALQDHAEDYKRFLAGKGSSASHVLLTFQRIRDILQGTKTKRLADLQAARIVAYLADRRREGLSVRSSNHYLRAVKMFTAWLVRERRLASDPLAHLSAQNHATDPRHQRRALSQAEFARLVDAAQAGPRIEGVTGPDRAVLYCLACFTGLRRGELASLTPRSFDLDSETPTVTVDAAYSKRRRLDRVPIHPALVDRLRAWTQGKPAAAVLLPVAKRKTYKMIRRDLERARAAWLDEAPTPAERAKREASSFLVYEDDGGRFADLHSLRHTFASELARAGVGVKAAQELLRHSTPALTLGVYSHVGLHDTAAAVASLPAPPRTSSDSDADAPAVRATGTGGAPMVDASSKGASWGALFRAPLNASPEYQCSPRCIEDADNGMAASDDNPVAASLCFPEENAAIRANKGPSRIGPHRQKCHKVGSEDDGARTRNLRIDSPVLDFHKSLQTNDLRESPEPGVLPGVLSESRIDPELARVVAAWPGLPEAIKASILAMIRAAN